MSSGLVYVVRLLKNMPSPLVTRGAGERGWLWRPPTSLADGVAPGPRERHAAAGDPDARARASPSWCWLTVFWRARRSSLGRPRNLPAMFTSWTEVRRPTISRMNQERLRRLTAGTGHIRQHRHRLGCHRRIIGPTSRGRVFPIEQRKFMVRKISNRRTIPIPPIGADGMTNPSRWAGRPDFRSRFVVQFGTPSCTSTTAMIGAAVEQSAQDRDVKADGHAIERVVEFGHRRNRRMLRRDAGETLGSAPFARRRAGCRGACWQSLPTPHHAEVRQVIPGANRGRRERDEKPLALCRAPRVLTGRR